MPEQTQPAEPKLQRPEKMGPVSETAGQINEVGRALKILEDKYSNLRKKVQVDDENSLSQQKKLSDNIRVMQSDLLEVKRELEDIKEKIRLIVKELKLTAREEDIKVVQKYLDLWEPVQFITRSEAKKMIERAVEEKFK
jgi:hypothetical protein